jgi:hypothetical protein
MAENKTAADRAADTKPTGQTEVERLRAEVERLRAQLAASGTAPRVAQPEHTFQLSEGDRQELEIRGVVNINGRLMTKADVEAELGENQQRVEIADAPEGTKVDPRTLQQVRERAANPVRGVDFVYPSVAPGKIDPAVAGTPGINGPSADAK